MVEDGLEQVPDVAVGELVVLVFAGSLAGDEALAPHGLKPSQFTILIAVGSYGSASPGQLTRALDLEKSTVSRGAERLAAGGWLEIVPAEQGRGVEYRLTRPGRKKLDAALPDWRRAQAEAKRRIGTEGVAALEGLVDDLGHA